MYILSPPPLVSFSGLENGETRGGEFKQDEKVGGSRNKRNRKSYNIRSVFKICKNTVN